MKLVLVVGPPRSGTSVTARILHEKLGVCMGHNLVEGNRGNPKGFYEDRKYIELITAQKHYGLCKALAHGCPVVGVKSPELVNMSFRTLNPDKIIRCRRPVHKVAASLVMWHQPPPTLDEAVEIVNRYETQLDNELMDIWPHKLWDIFYPKMRPEEEIEEELEFFLRGVNG